jgi:hypothetical protein
VSPASNRDRDDRPGRAKSARCVIAVPAGISRDFQ